MSGWMESRKKLEAFPGDKPEKLRSAFLTQGTSMHVSRHTHTHNHIHIRIRARLIGKIRF